MSGIRFVDPRCTCTAGARCAICRQRKDAHFRMYRLLRIDSHREAAARPVEYADQVTSMNDARTALSIAMGAPLDAINPVSGHHSASAR